MIKEPHEQSLSSFHTPYAWHTELLLLVFIVFFALLGLMICMNFSSEKNKKISYLTPIDHTEYNLT